jgi:hypothetical protein
LENRDNPQFGAPPAGKWPKARFGDAYMERTSAGHVHIKADRSKGITEIPGGFRFNFRGRRPLNVRHTRELTRALFNVNGPNPSVTVDIHTAINSLRRLADPDIDCRFHKSPAANMLTR